MLSSRICAFSLKEKDWTEEEAKSKNWDMEGEKVRTAVL